jgi:hypothetical protein
MASLLHYFNFCAFAAGQVEWGKGKYFFHDVPKVSLFSGKANA